VASDALFPRWRWRESQVKVADLDGELAELSNGNGIPRRSCRTFAA
jgi:hypothetical protein